MSPTQGKHYPLKISTALLISIRVLQQHELSYYGIFNFINKNPVKIRFLSSHISTYIIPLFCLSAHEKNLKYLFSVPLWKQCVDPHVKLLAFNFLKCANKVMLSGTLWFSGQK